MGSSGLILVVIVAAWALFLVPQWLSRRSAALDPVELAGDQRLVGEQGSVEVLEPQAAGAEATDVAADPVAPRSRTSRTVASVLVRRREEPATGKTARVSTALTFRARRGAEARTRARSAAQQRRRIVLSLAAATVLAGAGIAIAQATGVPASWLWLALPGALLVGYLALLAITRPGAARPASAHGSADPSSGSPQSSALEDASTTAELESTVSVGGRASDGAPGEQAVPATPVAQDPQAWTPRPVPLPSYVTAPKAPRRIRSIDLSAPGSWTAEPSAESRSESPADLEHEAEPEFSDQRRRVVGE